MNTLLYVVFHDISRISHILGTRLKVRALGVFALMGLQSFLELGFILTLTYMGLALTNSAALRENLLFRSLFFCFPSLEIWTLDPRKLVLLSGIIVVCVSIIKNCIAYISARRSELLSEDISIHIGKEIFERFLYRNYAWHLSSASAEMFQIMLWRTNISKLLICLLSSYASILTLSILFASLVHQEPVLTTLVISITGSIGFFLYRSIRRNVDVNAQKASQSIQEESRALLCATRGIRDVLIYRQQHAFLDSVMQAMCFGRLPKTFNGIAPTLPTWVLEATGFIVVVAAITYIVYVQDADTARITSALALLMLTAWRVLPYCNRIVGHQVAIRSIRPMTNAVLELLENLRKAPSDPPPSPATDFTFEKAITLENVCFRYPASTQDTLHNISCCIAKGRKIGIIGPSGAGKSTLVSVLSGLLSPTQGHIFVDGTALDPPRAAALATRIGYVPQSPFLFAGTLAENIAFSHWGEPWDAENMREACAKAAIDFVDAHPAGFDFLIGENGSGLSGGQAQRLSIARALYTKPSLLIFDEATSSLDQSNENSIQETIDGLAGEVTCILIAHRLTTVESCDTLLWMDKGRILMQGETRKVLAQYKKSQA